MAEVKLLDQKSWAEWNEFVESSPQGTIFSTTKWLSLYPASYKIMGYFKGNNLMGGFACFDTPQPCTPFQGILVAPIEGKYTTIMSLHNEVAKVLMPYLPNEFYNHYTYPDMRPFKWANWSVDVRYTYVVNCDLYMPTKLEKQTRYEIKNDNCEISLSNDIQFFDALYEQTFTRKGLERPVTKEWIYKLFSIIDNELYVASDNNSAVLMIKDNKRAYYILGASDGSGSSSTLWKALQGIERPEADLVGCNSESIALFKRGFGGKLVAYYGVKRNV